MATLGTYYFDTASFANATTIYDVPVLLRLQKLDEVVLKKIGLPIIGEPNMKYIKKP